jgi:hypothetical protein
VAVAALPVVELDVVALPLRLAVIVPALKLPEASRATTLEAVLADVASTDHVCADEPLYAVPLRYVPADRLFKLEPKATPEIVPADHVNADPFQFSTWLVALGAVAKAVVPALDWYAIWFAAPFARFVAVVALVAEPLSVAVIVPAEKLPDESRATTLEAVLADVASTVAVTALEPL